MFLQEAYDTLNEINLKQLGNKLSVGMRNSSKRSDIGWAKRDRFLAKLYRNNINLKSDELHNMPHLNSLNPLNYLKKKRLFSKLGEDKDGLEKILNKHGIKTKSQKSLENWNKQIKIIDDLRQSNKNDKLKLD